MDIRIIEVAGQGNSEAFGEIMRHYRGMAFAVAYDKLNNIQLAEDAVQEAFIEAYMNLAKLREAAAFPGWFKTIVVRQCQRVLRRKRHALLSLNEAVTLPHSAMSMEEMAERREGAQHLRELVEGLPVKLRVPVQLFYFYGYSLQEISGALGTPVTVLKKRLFDARRKLKGALPVIDVAAMFNLLYEGGNKMLHIVNGDVVGDKLRQGVVQGDVLVWREIYPAGPVFVNLSSERERGIRAGALEQTLGIPAKEYTAGCEQQEEKLQGFGRYDEVVLWFEHDLFDQSMLAYLLHWFNSQKPGSTRLSLLCIGEFPGIELFHGLGQLTAEQLQTLSGTWRSIGKKELELGSILWQAYAASSPLQLAECLEEHRTELAASALPFAYDAFRAHLSRLPSVYNGLGIVEQTTMEALRQGVNTPIELFRVVTDRLHVLGMGDLEYFTYLYALVQGSQPLVTIDGAAELTDFRKTTDFLHRRMSLTTLGEQVLAGAADRITEQGIDQWFGGLHLQGHHVPWRWDQTAGRPVQARTSTNPGSDA
ncbi:RNA polymerase subunit sigma [Paenibacillus sp. PK3_47]|uniref:sigma-70 family RNA polymerase sigma factor n=1 Tax=Paenibacillus sp. PK3_47 TaxID=2072642 RepID=UPI00201D80D2|nr:sigma-70 family RNA polymerase sigma factor [Paenibacillus sp. PK3_47]UQZ32485.1 RNA polymerase subunit sigma [Paenibacillus sp. PK3_47]